MHTDKNLQLTTGESCYLKVLTDWIDCALRSFSGELPNAFLEGVFQQQ
jgi:hypothetical protein